MPRHAAAVRPRYGRPGVRGLAAAVLALAGAAVLVGGGVGGDASDAGAGGRTPVGGVDSPARVAPPSPVPAPPGTGTPVGTATAVGTAVGTGTAVPSGPALPAVPVRPTGVEDVRTPAAVPPVTLTLPAVGITVPVDPVGVRADGQMEIPPLAERAGWYRFGSAPGEPAGTAVIAAHVDSVASGGPGPFTRLAEAAVGDAVHVTLADGSVRSYAVTGVERRAKPEIAWSDVFVRDGGPRLVLVTCGGTFLRDEGRYADNVMVTAEPAGGP